MWYFLLGLVAGCAATVVVVVRRRSTTDDDRTDRSAGATPPDVATEPSDDPVEPRLWERVIDSLPLGAIVIRPDGTELLRNGVARSIAGARHADVLIDEVVERMIATALAGRRCDEQIQLAGPPQRILDARALPLDGGGVLVTVEETTERWRLDQVRTDFVANVSHELKTPVGAISVLAETLEGETEDELVLRLVKRMIGESARMTRTIDDLLELSRIEMGGDAVMGPVDMNDVVAESIERVQPIASHDGVHIVVERAADALVTGDYFQLVSAVGNLVDNAVKYGRAGERVEVRVDASPSAVSVEVTDHGIGIPAGSLERIFERFYRVDRARSRDTGGTGLGLSIVRHVATNHGGEVNVRSHEGEGSTFVLRIPRNWPDGAGTMGSNDERPTGRQ